MPSPNPSKHLENTTELTMIIPVKPGFINAMDTCSYAGRLRIVMNSLNGLRKASREQTDINPIADAVDQIRTIQSFRLALLNNDTQLLLAVVFDGAWEPYIRKVWHNLGPLLDLIMCNCRHYPSAHNTPFSEYAAWIRRHQVEANFFYTASDLTVADFQYLRAAERNERETADQTEREQRAAHLYLESAQQQAAKVAKENPSALLRQGLKALGMLDSLRDLYPDGTEEGACLLRAAHELLKELKAFKTRGLPAPIRAQYEPQLLWFEQARNPRVRPAIESANVDHADIQGGILTRYPDVQCGALLLFRIHDLTAARQFLAKLPVSSEADKGTAAVFYNLALTVNGLKNLGIAASDMQEFPEEFLQGMEARAGLLGDERSNHPARWKLPQRNWPHNTSTSEDEIPLSSIDFIVQLRTSKPCKKNSHQIAGNTSHPLYKTIDRMSSIAGIELLSVEAMASYERGHFDFADGISQPVVQSKKRPSQWSDVVAVGEILLGHQNEHDLATAEQASVPPLLNNGTFLVLRKIQQNVEALNEFLDEQQSILADHKMQRDDLKALMLGRKPDGKPLVPYKGDNDFNFDSDKDGCLCPLQSHIRRCNPRQLALGASEDALPVPRIIRRGMSYGPKDAPKNEKRGLFFMAYNASIANQFEVIQGWIAGGNASNTYSDLADPFLGVPKHGEKRTFRCLSANNEVLRFNMDKSETEKRPFTELQWGSYLFVPSVSAIQQMTRPSTLQQHNELATGEAWIKKLQQIEQSQGPQVATEAWKTALEERTSAATGVTSAIWSAIRERHGALRTPYGVLVGREDLVAEVLADDHTFSVSGYADRMKKSLGSIFLGMDSGRKYYDAAEITNAAIGKITEREGFELARTYTLQKLEHLQQLTGSEGPITVSLRWVIDQVLADLSKHWFDLPDGTFIKHGGKPAPNKNTLHCPYHFTAPSRYIFSPNPAEFAAGLGEDAGSRLRLAAIEFVGAMRRKKNGINGAISKPMFDSIPNNEHLAQNIIGAMMGFLPTAMGLFLKSMYLWMKEEQLARLQQDFHREIRTVNFQNSRKLILPQLMIAMQKAPVPFMVWRTTTRPCTLGEIDLHRHIDGSNQADCVVIGISAITQGKLKQGELDVSPIFGGDRSAEQHPTHACPGQPLAMGVLLGVITALLEGKTLRDSGLPLVLEIH